MEIKKIDIFKVKKIMGLAMRYVREISIGAAVLILLGAILFMYNNCYQGLRKAKIAGVLKRQVAVNVVDIGTWEKIKKDTEWKKQEVQDGEIGRNPFK